MQSQIHLEEKKLPLYAPKTDEQAKLDAINNSPGHIDYGSSKLWKVVRYEQLVPHLIEAVKELKSEIEELKNKLGDK